MEEDDGTSLLRCILAGVRAGLATGCAPLSGTDAVGTGFVEPGNHVGRDSRVAGAQIGRTRIEQLVRARPLVRLSGGWSLRRLEPRGIQVARRYSRTVPALHADAVLQSIPEKRSAG